MRRERAWRKVCANRGLVNAVLDECFPWIFQEKNSQVMSYHDYIHVGIVGLYTAARKYRPNRKCKFCTYAWIWIYQAISRAYRNEGFKAVRIPCFAIDRLSKLKKRIIPKDSPSDKDLRRFEAALHKKGHEIEKAAYEATYGHVSLNEQKTDRDHNPTETIIAESVSFACEPEAIGKIEADEKATIVSFAVNTLLPDERAVIEMRFGLNGHGGETYGTMEISRELNIPRNNIQGLESSAIGKLGRVLKAMNLAADQFNLSGE